jgi:hypothetical protein
MTRSLLLLLAIASCTPAVAVERAVDVPMEDAWQDAENATATLAAVRTHLEAMSPRQRAEVQAAAHVLITNCPYNRSSVQLPLAMGHVLARHDDPALAGLRKGVAQHVALLDLLGVLDLAKPGTGDYLDRDIPGLVTREQLESSADPVETTMAFLLQVKELVDAYDPATKAKIDEASAVVKDATLGQWTLKGQLIGFRSELETLAATTPNERVRTDADALVGLISQYVSLYC